MILRFYCRPLTAEGQLGPLLATATVPGDGNSGDTEWVQGTVEFFDPVLDNYINATLDWSLSERHFREELEETMNSYVPLTNREPLRPWSREAFENIAKFGLLGFRHIVEAKLFEDDGLEWDPQKSIPLYGPDPGPYGRNYDHASEQPGPLTRTRGRFYVQRDGTIQRDEP